ncbi:MAG: molybdopterin synthase catalytic subunit MoaE [Psychromonas sp.]
MIRVQAEDFNQQVEYDRLCVNASVGAIVTFTGLVRDMNQGEEVSSLTLEHYPGMTESCLAEIVEKAKLRWNILEHTVIHRIGELNLQEQIVFVGIASAHRQEAFAACEFIMDYLKTAAPFWKKEVNSSGKSYWVDARESDDHALHKWSEK